MKSNFTPSKMGDGERKGFSNAEMREGGGGGGGRRTTSTFNTGA